MGKSRECYMKQKHRLVWERRHGPVGTGMKTTETAAEAE
jgi:NADH dehydrogenase (ubiquinone) 1 beta subcomplex subunit 10